MLLVHRPPNTDILMFIKDMERILNNVDYENRDIFMIGDLNYNTFKTLQPSNIKFETFTNVLA